jgi:hypothetical protein
MTTSSQAQEQPETPAQAKEWDKRFSAYQRGGLCPRCASQAAWGHQFGFTRVHAPWQGCLPIVETFPKQEAGPWRSVPRGHF